MKVTEEAVILPRLREASANRVTGAVGDQTRVQVPKPKPAPAFNAVNARGNFARRSLEELHERMRVSAVKGAAVRVVK